MVLREQETSGVQSLRGRDSDSTMAKESSLSVTCAEERLEPSGREERNGEKSSRRDSKSLRKTRARTTPASPSERAFSARARTASAFISGGLGCRDLGLVFSASGLVRDIGNSWLRGSLKDAQCVSVCQERGVEDSEFWGPCGAGFGASISSRLEVVKR